MIENYLWNSGEDEAQAIAATLAVCHHPMLTAEEQVVRWRECAEVTNTTFVETLAQMREGMKEDSGGFAFEFRGILHFVPLRLSVATDLLLYVKAGKKVPAEMTDDAVRFGIMVNLVKQDNIIYVPYHKIAITAIDHLRGIAKCP